MSDYIVQSLIEGYETVNLIKIRDFLKSLKAKTRKNIRNHTDYHYKITESFLNDYQAMEKLRRDPYTSFIYFKNGEEVKRFLTKPDDTYIIFYEAIDGYITHNKKRKKEERFKEETIKKLNGINKVFFVNVEQLTTRKSTKEEVAKIMNKESNSQHKNNVLKIVIASLLNIAAFVVIDFPFSLIVLWITILAYEYTKPKATSTSGGVTPSIGAAQKIEDATIKEKAIKAEHSLNDELWGIYKSIKEKVDEYRTDLFLNLAYPAMTNPAIETTSILNKALANVRVMHKIYANQEIKLDDSIYKAIIELDIAFKNAEKYAKDKGQFVWDEPSRKKVMNAEKMFRIASDTSASETERKNSLKQGQKELKGIVHIEELIKKEFGDLFLIEK